MSLPLVCIKNVVPWLPVGVPEIQLGDFAFRKMCEQGLGFSPEIARGQDIVALKTQFQELCRGLDSGPQMGPIARQAVNHPETWNRLSRFLMGPHPLGMEGFYSLILGLQDCVGVLPLSAREEGREFVQWTEEERPYWRYIHLVSSAYGHEANKFLVIRGTHEYVSRTEVSGERRIQRGIIIDADRFKLWSDEDFELGFGYLNKGARVDDDAELLAAGIRLALDRSGLVEVVRNEVSGEPTIH